jgi:hypothetical protein
MIGQRSTSKVCCLYCYVGCVAFFVTHMQASAAAQRYIQCSHIQRNHSCHWHGMRQLLLDEWMHSACAAAGA